MPENLPRDWEMSPRYHVFDSAVRADQSETRWQLHLIKQPSWNYSFLWMRPLDSSDDAGFVLFDPRFSRTRFFTVYENLSDLEATVKRTLKNDLLVRRFVLNTRLGLRRGNQRAHEVLTVRRDGVADWERPRHNTRTLFRWRQMKTPIKSAKWLQMPAAQIWDELQNLLADPNSEANFARQFDYLDPTERAARIRRINRGALDELDHLLNDIVFASPQWNDLGEDSQLSLAIIGSGEVVMREFRRGLPPKDLEPPDFVRENVRALWDYFQPFDRDISNFLCVQSSGYNSLSAHAFRPSAHEQIEAHLRLRAFVTRVSSL